MANTKSAIKELRKNKKRHMKNKAVKSALKTYIKKTKVMIEKNDLKEVQKFLPGVYSKIDKSARHNLIHWKKAARIKSRLTNRMNAIKAVEKNADNA